MTDWHARHLEHAKFMSGWSKDPSSQVGATIVDERNRVVGVGFNGFPRGVCDLRSRLDDRETRISLTLHAEVNAIMNSTASVRGCRLYVWPYPPCTNCALHIIQSGISEVYAPEPSQAYLERWGCSRKLLLEGGVFLRELTGLVGP